MGHPNPPCVFGIVLQASNLSYTITLPDGSLKPILTNPNFRLEPGQLVGLVGGNGSGKSTLARLLNGLLRPAQGSVEVDGLDTSDLSLRRQILGLVGMVFQNPDSQLVGTVVEEDLAFGPENHGLAPQLILERVEWALDAVGIRPLRCLSPQRLSGGQKQRVAIAAALALQPRYLILDEPTSMLDPAGRQDFLEVIELLRRDGRFGILLITHRLEELTEADLICFLEGGELKAQMPYNALPSQRSSLQAAGVGLPGHMELAVRLKERGLPVGDLSDRAALKELLGRYQFSTPEIHVPLGGQRAGLFRVENLSCLYGRRTPWEFRALDDVSLCVRQGEALGLMGATGSGKSTLAQHLNGLLRPGQGRVIVENKPVPPHGGDLAWLRRLVGLVFQNPENQFFEETVGAEISFGPHNFGLRGQQLESAVRESLAQVGLDWESFQMRSPHELSGGEKRLVALASVLASAPSTLILDEPTAGLDSHHRQRVLDLLKGWRETTGGTLIVISHELEDLAFLVERCLVLERGRVLADEPFTELLPRLPALGLPLPWLPSCLLRHPAPPQPVPVLLEEFLALDFSPLTPLASLDNSDIIRQ